MLHDVTSLKLLFSVGVWLSWDGIDDVAASYLTFENFMELWNADNDNIEVRTS